MIEDDSKKMTTEQLLEYVKNFEGFRDHRKFVEDIISEQVKRYKKELNMRNKKKG